MVAESQRSCQEVWSPGYDHSPELSDNEEPQGRPQDASLALRSAVKCFRHDQQQASRSQDGACSCKVCNMLQMLWQGQQMRLLRRISPLNPRHECHSSTGRQRRQALALRRALPLYTRRPEARLGSGAGLLLMTVSQRQHQSPARKQQY